MFSNTGASRWDIRDDFGPEKPANPLKTNAPGKTSKSSSKLVKTRQNHP
jgi:hypothetical protein